MPPKDSFMQFITHQSHNGKHPSLLFPLLPFSLLSISFSSFVHTAPSPPALSANSRSLSSLHGDFFFSPQCLSCSLVVGVGTSPRLSLHHCYLVAVIMMPGTRDVGTEGSGKMECSSTTTASDCIKQLSYTAKGLTRDVVIYPLLLCAFSYTDKEINESLRVFVCSLVR